jgi:sugar (pentulose or hexulose) kinase
MVGGPAESPVWPQIIADILGLEIEIQKGQMMGAAGAALTAGCATGVFSELHEAHRLLHRKQTTVCPDPSRHALYAEIFQDYIEAEYGGKIPSLIVE